MSWQNPNDCEKHTWFHSLPEIAVNSDDFPEDIVASEEGAQDDAGEDENIVDVVD